MRLGLNPLLRSPILPIIAAVWSVNCVIDFGGTFVLAELTYSHEVFAMETEILIGLKDTILIFSVPLALSLLLAVRQAYPLIQAYGPSGVFGARMEEARTILLSAPLRQAFYGAGAWPVLILTSLAIIWFRGIEIPPLVAVDWFISSILFSTLCFAITHYLLKFIIQKFYVMRLYPGGIIAGEHRGAKLSMGLRFCIHYTAICILPIWVMLHVIWGQVAADRLAILLPELALMTGSLLAVCAILTWGVYRAYAQAFSGMGRVVRRVSIGDYSARVIVRSNDEMAELAAGINEMAKGLLERERLRLAFGRAVDPAVRDHLLRGHTGLGGDIKEAAVLFSDIRGFTKLSESLQPNDVVSLLNRYFESAGECIDAEGGVVNKYIGDSILAVFGVPVLTGSPAFASVRAAIAMRKAVANLNLRFAEDGLPPIRVGIGIHVGNVLAGNIGTPTRSEFTVIGDVVNTASRVEGLCKRLQRDLLITSDVRGRLGQEFEFEFAGEHQLRGRDEPIKVYTIA